MSATTNYNDEMAPFWAFVAKVQEQGTSHPWFQRRARIQAARAAQAEAGEAGEVQHEQPANPWKLRRVQGLGPRGPMRRRQQHQEEQQTTAAAVLPVEIQSLVPENEKVEVKEVLFEMPLSDAEKADSAVEAGRPGPGARRGAGRGGRGGRGQGLGRAHRLAAANREINAAQTKIPVESESEKTVSGDEGRGGPGARRGGPGRRRGLGGPRANRLAREQIAVAPEAATVARPQAGMRGPGNGMRGMRGAGMGRARGANMARNIATNGAGIQDAQAGNGLRQGPGAGRGRGMGAGRGRGQGFGCGRGAATAARNMSQGPKATQHNGPHARRQSRGPAGPRSRSLSKGPNANRARTPSNSNEQVPRFGPRMRRFRPLGPKMRNNSRKGPFTPEIDIFDLKEAIIVHASLPGAKKEDIEVNWDAETSALNIAGKIRRVGNQELVKRIAMNERKAGKFSRKVQMPPKANIDVEAISAKVEDGILKVEVPKMDAGFVEVRKVDIN